MSRFINVDPRGFARCWWCASEPIYVQYHDRQWGVPTKNDHDLFEKICLEGFQSGLSWITILKKRPAFRVAFHQFDFHQVAQFQKPDIDQLLNNREIVRHAGKINATVNNAQRAIEMIDRFGSLARFFWQFEPSQPPRFNAHRAFSTESSEMSRQLKRLGWQFVGPTTCYSLMQAVGMVNDHHPKCFRWAEIHQKRERFRRPSKPN